MLSLTTDANDHIDIIPGDLGCTLMVTRDGTDSFSVTLTADECRDLVYMLGR